MPPRQLSHLPATTLHTRSPGMTSSTIPTSSTLATPESLLLLNSHHTPVTLPSFSFQRLPVNTTPFGLCGSAPSSVADASSAPRPTVQRSTSSRTPALATRSQAALSLDTNSSRSLYRNLQTPVFRLPPHPHHNLWKWRAGTPFMKGLTPLLSTAAAGQCSRDNSPFCAAWTTEGP